MAVGQDVASGAGTGFTFGGPLGAAIGGGVGLLAGLFGGGGGDKPDANAATSEIDLLKGYGEQSRKQGQEFIGQGQEAIIPALEYYNNILSSNPAGVLEATKPERGRVIDQYDTARRNLVNFGPRAGGTASSLAGLEVAKANQLSDLTAEARRTGASESADLGATLAGLGITEENAGAQNLSSAIQALLTKAGYDVTKRGQNLEAASGLGEAAGTLIGILLTRGQQAA